MHKFSIAMDLIEYFGYIVTSHKQISRNIIGENETGTKDKHLM